MNGGYVFLYRDLINSSIFKDPWLLKIWIWCLLKACYSPQKIVKGNTVINLERGQFLFGREKASEELSFAGNIINPSTLYRKIKLLETIGSISLKANSLGTVITVVNYNIYQPFSFETEQKVNNKRTASEHIQKYNKDNNILSSSLYAHAREELTSDDILAFEELSLLPLSAQSELEDTVAGLVKKYFNRGHTPHDIATMYWWLELLNKKPQITDSDIAILKKAFEIAFDCNAVNYAYVNGIFENWSENGIRTIDDYRFHEMKRKCNYG